LEAWGFGNVLYKCAAARSNRDGQLNAFSALDATRADRRSVRPQNYPRARALPAHRFRFGSPPQIIAAIATHRVSACSPSTVNSDHRRTAR
jgi:hypothetical protein